MVVRLSDSQIGAFESAGISRDQIGSIIADARSQGVGDDVIYNDLSRKANAYAVYAGAQIKELDAIDDERKQEQIIQMADQLASKKQEPIVGALTQHLREKAGDQPFFNPGPTPDVLGSNQTAYNEQKAAFEYGKNLSAAETFALAGGDALMLSGEDFIFPEAEMVRAGAAQKHPFAGAVGAAVGAYLGIPGRVAKVGLEGTGKLFAKSTKEGVKQPLKKKLARMGVVAVTDAAIGTATLAAQDAIQVASKNDEWRTFRVDSRRYADDFANGLGWSAAFGIGGSYIARYRRGARNAANRFGGVERVQVLQKERQKMIDGGMSEVEATEWFNRALLAGLEPEEQRSVAEAAKYNRQFRQYLNDIAVTTKNDIDRSATLITKKEIKNVTDDSMAALKRNQGLGDVDFDTSAEGLKNALGTKSAKNIEAGKNLAKEGNIILTQDPEIHNAFKTKTRQAAQMGDNTIYNKLVDGAEIGDFPELMDRARGAGLDLNGPEAKAMAQEHAKKLLDEGMDYVSDVNDMKGLIDRLAKKGDVQSGKGSKVGTFREGLNETLETAFGDPDNPATLSGKYRGYHNVKHFEDIMVEAHKYGKELDPIDQAESLSKYLNSHGNASADEAIAITTAVKMGYLDKLKDLAKKGDRAGWKQAIDGAKKNPQLRDMLGGESGIMEYVKQMEPEVRAAESLKNILIAARPGSQSDKVLQDMIGGTVAAATNSPLGLWGRIQNLWAQVAPGGVTPAVAKNMEEIMSNPTWTNFNKFISTASKDPATRLQLSRTIDAWFQEMSAAATVSGGESERLGAQNAPSFKGGM